MASMGITPNKQLAWSKVRHVAALPRGKSLGQVEECICPDCHSSNVDLVRVPSDFGQRGNPIWKCRNCDSAATFSWPFLQRGKPLAPPKHYLSEVELAMVDANKVALGGASTRYINHLGLDPGVRGELVACLLLSKVDRDRIFSLVDEGHTALDIYSGKATGDPLPPFGPINYTQMTYLMKGHLARQGYWGAQWCWEAEESNPEEVVFES